MRLQLNILGPAACLIAAALLFCVAQEPARSDLEESGGAVAEVDAAVPIPCFVVVEPAPLSGNSLRRYWKPCKNRQRVWQSDRVVLAPNL